MSLTLCPECGGRELDIREYEDEDGYPRTVLADREMCKRCHGWRYVFVNEDDENEHRDYVEGVESK